MTSGADAALGAKQNIERQEWRSIVPSAFSRNVSVARDLEIAQRAFASLIEAAPVTDPAAFYNDVRGRGYHLNHVMQRAITAGMPIAEIRELVTDARAAYQRASFVHRVSEWPRGYRGDFETITQVVTMANGYSPTSPEHYIQQFILDTGMSQQHRNKMAAQSKALMWGLTRRPDARVLSIASGAAPEFATFAPYIRHEAQTIVLNDGEAEALDQALGSFVGSDFSPTLVAGNVLRRIPQLERLGPYDTVVAGGLYDYLDLRSATLLTKMILGRLLRPGGRFFFTNIAPRNPYRPWLECIADWPLVERSQDDIRALVTSISDDCSVETVRDETGLAEMVTVERQAA